MKFLSGVLGLFVLALALSFALANRQATVIQFWPFGVSIEAPLYLLTLGTLLFGLLIGAAIGWFAHIPHRMAAWRLRRDVTALQDKIDSIHAAAAAPILREPDDEDDGGDLRFLPVRKPFWKIGT